MTTSRKQPVAASLFRLLRLNRSLMVAIICGAGAYVAGAGWQRSLWMLLAGWLLAVGGFSLDLVADRDLDRRGPRAHSRRNPVADGSLPPPAGLAFSGAFIVASLVLTAWVALPALLEWALILAVVAGLALHLFEAPLARALTLGLLQACTCSWAAQPAGSLGRSASCPWSFSSPCSAAVA